jgi:hypothetical protein
MFCSEQVEGTSLFCETSVCEELKAGNQILKRVSVRHDVCNARIILCVISDQPRHTHPFERFPEEVEATQAEWQKSSIALI